MTNIEHAARQLNGEDWRDAAYPIARYIITRLSEKYTDDPRFMQMRLATPKLAMEMILDEIEPDLIQCLGWERFEAILKEAVEAYH